MPHAIIRGKNGRRHKSILARRPSASKFTASGDTVEMFVEADLETGPGGRRRFAIVSIPRHQFSEATGAAARRGTAEDVRLPGRCVPAVLVGYVADEAGAGAERCNVWSGCFEVPREWRARRHEMGNLQSA